MRNTHAVNLNERYYNYITYICHRIKTDINGILKKNSVMGKLTR